MLKRIMLIIALNLIFATIAYNVAAVSSISQKNSEITYKEAMMEISAASNKPVEKIIIDDKLTTKRYNYLFKYDNKQLNYIKMEAMNEHGENEELKAKWLGILKVDYENKLIVDLCATAISVENLHDRYDFTIGGWGYDWNGDSINGYYDNVYTSGIVEFKSKENYKNYYFTHYLYFIFDSFDQ